jgi:hypothetical protein
MDFTYFVFALPLFVPMTVVMAMMAKSEIMKVNRRG